MDEFNCDFSLKIQFFKKKSGIKTLLVCVCVFINADLNERNVFLIRLVKCKHCRLLSCLG